MLRGDAVRRQQEHRQPAPFAGTLESGARACHARPTVAKGTTIFRLVALAPADRDARIEAERIASEAEGRNEMAAKRAERATMLVKDGSGSQRAVEEAQAELVAAAAASEAPHAIVSRRVASDQRVGAISIDAPETSLLRAVYATPGQTVAAGALSLISCASTPCGPRPVVRRGSQRRRPARAARIVPLGADAATAGVAATPVTAPPSADPSTASVDLYYSLSNVAANVATNATASATARLRPESGSASVSVSG